MSNKIQSFQFENMRRGRQFFDLAAHQLKTLDGLHETFYSAFLNQFDDVVEEYEEYIEYDELRFPQINNNYLHALIKDPSEFIEKFTNYCIKEIQKDLINAFESKKVKAEGRIVEVVWSYIGHRFPNKYVYTLELSQHDLRWKLISGRFENYGEGGELELPLEVNRWYP